MSTNVKFLNQKDTNSSKNCLQKKFGLNTKAIPSKSFRQKIEKSKNTKQPLGVINENDINQANVKAKNIKESQIKKTKTLVNKSTNSNINNAHFHRLSSFNMDNDKEKNEIITSSPKANSSLNLENLIVNVSLSKKNKIDTDDYREMFSKYVRDTEDSLSGKKAGELQSGNHKITERMRTRMVDWMIEVLSNYHCDESTYFEAINLMDRYFKVCDEKRQILQPPELHLIGVTSMFIASKYQDIYPLRLKIVKDKIAHNKLSCQEIKDKEDEITRYLDYNLGLPTMWDFINLYLEEIFYINCNKHHIKNQILLDTYYKTITTEEDEQLGNVINKKYTKNMLNLLKYVCVYLAKMNCHDYQLMQKKHSLLAASTIFVAIKICEQINKEEYINDYFTDKLNEISNNSENDIIKTAQKILYNAQNFDTKFNGLENLKKVHFNAIIELKETK